MYIWNFCAFVGRFSFLDGMEIIDKDFFSLFTCDNYGMKKDYSIHDIGSENGVLGGDARPTSCISYVTIPIHHNSDIKKEEEEEEEEEKEEGDSRHQTYHTEDIVTQEKSFTPQVSSNTLHAQAQP